MNAFDQAVGAGHQLPVGGHLEQGGVVADAQHALWAAGRVRIADQSDAEAMARRLAVEEGLFAGISAAGACCVALRLAAEVRGATIVFIVCDRGDRYLSTGVFPG